jgi:hypothetical protein
MSIARAHFTPAEQDHLLAIGDATRRRLAFLELWTAKEAFIKAMGEGLSMGRSTASGVDAAGDRYGRAGASPCPRREPRVDPRPLALSRLLRGPRRGSACETPSRASIAAKRIGSPEGIAA